VLEDGGDHVHAGHVLHVQVGQHDVVRPPLEHLDPLVPLRGDLHAVAQAGEDRLAALAQRPLIVDEEDAERGAELA
jgi:hypothetical protein